MTIPIPSTQALKVFEVVARHLNCSRAARELFLTTGAVSKQVQSLETTLGVELFIRGRHGLRLTEAGQIYLDGIKPAMIMLEEAGVKATRQHHRLKELHIRMLPALAERWLLPCYSEFAEANPDLNIQFDISALRDEGLLFTYDAYFRFGRGRWPGCVADYLCGHQFIMVASPALLKGQRAIQAPADLLQYPLFEHAWTPLAWSRAFDALGVTPDRALNITKWDFFSVIIRNVCVGQGLALVPKAFINEELASGELVQVLGYTQRSPFGYYFVVSEGRQDDMAIVRFRNWLRTKRSAGEDPGFQP